MIDFIGYYYYQAEKMTVDLMNAKIDLRNLLVYLNNQVIKLANTKPGEQNP